MFHTKIPTRPPGVGTINSHGRALLHIAATALVIWTVSLTTCYHVKLLPSTESNNNAIQIIYTTEYDLDSRNDAIQSTSELFLMKNKTKPSQGENSVSFLDSGVVQKSQDHSHLRKMISTSNPIYFIHIGKAVGSSIDRFMQSYRTKFKVPKRYIGFNHFDWSFIQMHEKKRLQGSTTVMDASDEEQFNVYPTADVITFLRNPVSRSLSQFYFSKTLPWARDSNQTFIQQTIVEYLNDENKTWFQPLNDGEGGVDFFAGVFKSADPQTWVQTDGIESDFKKYVRDNKTAACLLAAKRLEQTTWFGILEDMERSMELLQVTLDLKQLPILPVENKAGNNYPIPSVDTVAMIERYLQKDMWLYEYANRLLNARWEYFLGNNSGAYMPPELPNLPSFSSQTLVYLNSR